jgi:hypothetical protein
MARLHIAIAVTFAAIVVVVVAKSTTMSAAAIVVTNLLTMNLAGASLGNWMARGHTMSGLRILFCGNCVLSAGVAAACWDAGLRTSAAIGIGCLLEGHVGLALGSLTWLWIKS